MSIMDVDKADEKIDYEVLYKKRFEEIESNIKNIQRLYSVDNEAINKLSYSLVIKAINSETHSCTHSFASFEIFADCGMDRFIIRLMLAIGR